MNSYKVPWEKIKLNNVNKVTPKKYDWKLTNVTKQKQSIDIEGQPINHSRSL